MVSNNPIFYYNNIKEDIRIKIQFGSYLKKLKRKKVKFLGDSKDVFEVAQQAKQVDQSNIQKLKQEKEIIKQETQHAISEIDKNIARIQKSTRTTIPSFSPLHNKLRARYRWYYKWHLIPYVDLMHWLTLVIYVTAIFYAFYLATISGEHKMAFAGTMTDLTWDGGGDGSTWADADNWGGTGIPDTNEEKAIINTGSASITIPASTTLGELEIGSSYSGTITIGGTLTLDDAFDSSGGDLTLNGGTLSASTNNPNINIDGNISIGSGGTFTKGTGILGFTGEVAKTFTDSNSTKQNMGKVVIAKESGIEENDVVTLGSSMTVDTLIIDGPSETLGPINTLNLGSSGYVLKIANAGSTATVFTNRGVLTPGTSTVEYAATNSGGNINITTTTYNSLKTSGSETYDLTGNLTSTNALTGDLEVGSGSTLDVRVSSTDYNITAVNITITGTLDGTDSSATITGSGNWSRAGTFNYGTTTVDLNNTGNVHGSFYNLKMGYTSKTSTLTNDIGIYNQLTTQQGTVTGSTRSIIFYGPDGQSNPYVSDATIPATMTINNIELRFANSTINFPGGKFQKNLYFYYNGSGSSGTVNLTGNIATPADDYSSELYIYINGYSTGKTTIVDTDGYSVMLTHRLQIGNPSYNYRYGKLIVDNSTLNVGSNGALTTGQLIINSSDASGVNELEMTGSSSRINMRRPYEFNSNRSWTNSDTFTPGSGTVDFQGNNWASRIETGGTGTGKAFYDVIFSRTAGSALPILGNADMEVTHNLTINSSSGINLNGYNLYVGGAYSNSGTLTTTTSTVFLNGTGAQSITAGGTGTGKTFNNLTVTNASTSGVTFADSATVTGTFTDTTPASKLTFNAGSTYAFANISLAGATGTGNKVTLTGSSTWYFNVSQTSPTASYVDVMNSNASGGNEITASNSTNSGGNTNWNFSVPTVSIAGTVYTAEDKSTNIGADITIAISVNGGAKSTVESTTGGAFSFPSVAVSANQTITIFIDDETPNANFVSQVVDDQTNISGLELYTDKIVLSHETAGPMTNTLLATADGAADDDMFFSESSGTVTFNDGYELWITSGKTYTPGGAIITDDVELAGTATLNSSTYDVTIHGSWKASSSSTLTTSGTYKFTSINSETITSNGKAFNNMTINNGLVGYWKLDEGTGTSATIYDASGNAENGTMNNFGGTPWTTSVKDSTYYGNNPSALTFDDSDSFISVSHDANFDLAPSSTMSLWMKFSSTANKVVLEKNGNSGYSLQINNGTISCWFGGVNNGPVTTSTINDDNWHLVTIVYTANGADGAKIYVDGTHGSTGDDPAAPSYGSSTPVYIGARNGTFGFGGSLDDIRIYNRALSSTEIGELYNGTHPVEGTYTLSDALDVNNDLAIRTGKLDVSSSDYAVNVGGSYVNVANLNGQEGTLTLDAGSGSKTVQSDPPFNNLTFNNGSGGWTLDKQRLDVNGILNVNAGTFSSSSTTCTGGSCGLFIAGNMTIASGAVYTKGGLLTFDGTTAKTYTDSNATATNLGNVSLNKSDSLDPSTNNKITLASNMTVDTMTIGTISGEDNYLNLGSSGYILKLANAGTSASVFINYGSLVPGTSTVEYSATNSTGNINILTAPYSSLKVSGSETYVLTGNLTSTNGLGGNLEIATGATLDTVSGSNYNIDVAGSWTNGGTFTANSGTVTFDGTASGKTIDAGPSYLDHFYTLVINSSDGNGGWTLARDCFAVYILVTSGTLNTSSYDLGGIDPYTYTTTINGGTLNGGSGLLYTDTLAITSGTFVAGSGAVHIGYPMGHAGTYTHTSGSADWTTNNSTLYISSTGSKTIPADTYHSLTLRSNIGGNPSYSLNGSATVEGNLTLEQAMGSTALALTTYTFDVYGDVTINADTTLSMTSGTLKVGGNYVNSGILTPGTGTVEFTKASSTQTLNSGGTGTGKAFNHLVHSGAGTLQLDTNHLEINGDFTHNAGSFNANGKNINIAGSWLVTAPNTLNNTVTFDGNSSGKIIKEYDGSNLINKFGTLTINGSGGGWTVDTYNLGFSTLNVTAGTLNMGTYSNAVGSYYPQIIVNGGSLVGDSGTIYANGGLTISDGSFTACAIVNVGSVSYSSTYVHSGGTADWTTNSSTLNYYAGTVTLPTDTYNNVYLAGPQGGPATFNLGGNTSINGNLTNGTPIPGNYITLAVSTHTLTVGGDVTIASGGVYSMTSGTLKIAGNYSNSGTLTPGTGTVEFTKSSGTQTLNSGGTGTNKLFNNFLHSGAGTLQLITNNLDINGNFTNSAGTFDTNGKDITVAGNWTNSATFTSGTRTVTFDGTATGKTINMGSSSFYNLTFNGSGGAWSPLTNTMTVTNDLTMTAGTLDTSNGTANVMVNGNVTGTNGIINMTSTNTFIQITSSAKTFGPTSGSIDWTFYNLEFWASITSATSINSGTGKIIINSVLYIDIFKILDAGSKTFQLNGSGTPFVKTGTLTPSTSTFSYEGTSATNITSATYYNIQTNPPSGTPTYTFASGTTSVGGNLTLTGAGTGSLTAETNDPTLSVTGNVSIGSGQTLIASSTGTFNVGGNWTNGGTFTKGTGTVTFNGTTTGHTINTGGTGTGKDFYNVIFNGSGGAWSPLTNTMTVTNDLTMTAGTFDTSNGTADVVVNGNVTGTNGIINMTSTNTFYQSITSSKNFGTTSGSTSWEFNNLTFSSNGGMPPKIIYTQTGGNGDITVNGSLSVISTSLNAGNRVWRLKGSGDVINLLVSSSISASTSTFSYENTTSANIKNTSYYNLQTNPLSGTPTYTFATGTTSIGGGLTMTGAGTGTLTAATNNPTLSVTGNVSIGSGQTLIASSTGTFNVAGNWTNAGTLTPGTGTITFNKSSSTQTLNSGGTGAGKVFNNIVHSGAGTLQLSTNAIQVDGTFTNSAGTFDSNGLAQTVNGNWSLSGGTYTSPTNADLTLLGNMTISSGTTFTKASGTGKLILEGDATTEEFQDLTSPQQDLGSVVIGTSPGTTNLNSDMTATNLTINSGDTLNTKGFEINLSDYLTCDGTLNVNDNVETDDTFITLGGNFTMNQSTGTYTDTDYDSEIVFTGNSSSDQTFTTGAEVYGRITINNDESTYDDLDVSGTLDAHGNITITDGNLDLNQNDPIADLEANLTISTNGTLTASNSADFTIAGNWSNSGTFTHSDGGITFDGTTTQTITGANTFYNLTINNSYATPDDTYDVDPNAIQTVTNNLNVTDGQWTPYTGDTYKNVTIGTNGIIKPDSGATIYVSGNWSKTGTFTHNNSTVSFKGTTISVISGSSTFYNLTMDTNADGAKQINFTAASTQTISNTWTLDGDTGKVLTLRSTSDTNAWYFVIPADINPSGDYIDVKDSQNTTNSYRITPGTNVTNSGNNDPGWIFITNNTLSGSLYDGIGGSKIVTAKTIAVSVNGASATTDTSSSGDFTIDAGVTFSPNDIISVYVSGDSVKASAITKVSASGNLTGIDIFQNYTTIRHEGDITSITNTDIDTADNVADTDLLVSISTGNATFTNGTYILSSKTYAPGGNVTIGGSYTNSGIFTASTYTVTFNSTTTGNILAGNLTSSNSFNKLVFNGAGGGWTINDPITITADATDTLNIANGTVTLGDGNGDNMEVRGRMNVATTANQTSTFQTYDSLTPSQSIIIDINQNNSGAPPACTNCGIYVGATSGTGQGNFKTTKNTLLRLNPDSTAQVDLPLITQSTGYLEIQGSQDATGTSTGATETTLTDSSKSWTIDEHIGKTLRMTSGLAFGKLYDITDNDGTSVTRADTSSVTETSPTLSGSGPSRVLTLTTQDDIITANNDHIGRYVHDLDGGEYYKIVDSAQVGAGTDTLTIIAEPASDFSTLATNNDIEVTDAIISSDTYEILNYAYVTAEAGTACNATVNETGKGESYIYSQSGSETKIQYGSVCNLGRNTDTKYGTQNSSNGNNTNEGFLLSKSKISTNYIGIHGGSNNNANNSEGILNNYFYNNPTGVSYSFNCLIENNNISYSTTAIYNFMGNLNTYRNNILSNGTQGIYLNNWNKANIIESNTFYNFSFSGIRFQNSPINTLIKNNTAFGNGSGFAIEGRSLYYNNHLYHNGTGVSTLGSSIAINNNIYSNTTGTSLGSNQITIQNNIYNNTNGLLVDCCGTSGGISILDNFGQTYQNTNYDINLSANYTKNYKLYGTLVNSTNKVYLPSSATNNYILFKNYNGTSGSTKIWNDYTVPTDNTETPQNESIDKFNYADNTWEKSASPHIYGGNGTEDTNIGYDLTSSDLSSGPYAYRIVTKTAGSGASCGTTQAVFDVYRNETDVGDATSGTQFTDTNGSVNVKFTIECGATPYALGDTYMFVVWDASNDTNVDKNVEMQQAGDSITVPSGSEIQFTGASSHNSILSAKTSTNAFDIINNGTISGTYNSLTVNGSVTGSGIFNLSTDSTFNQRVAGASKTFGSTSGSSDWTFNDLKFENGYTSNQTITTNTGGTGKIITNGTLTIGNASDTYTTTIDNETNDRILDIENVSITSKGLLSASSTADFTTSGNWTNGGSFSANSGTVTFDGTNTGKTINTGGTGTGKSFYNLTHSGAGTLQIDTNNIKINNNLTNSAGTFDVNAKDLYVGQNWDNTATISNNTGTVTFDGDNKSGIIKSNGSSFNDVKFDEPTYQPITNGIVGHWKLDEGTDTSAYDSSGNNYTGTLTNGPTWTSSVKDSNYYGGNPYATNFDGSNDHILLGNLPNLNFSGTSSFTISTWVKLNSDIGSTTLMILGKWNGGVVGQYYLGINNNKIKFSREISPWYINGTTTLSTGTWYHIVAQYDGTNAKIYLNGNSDATPVAMGSIASQTNNIYIGSAQVSNSPNRFFPGVIDDVRVYNRALSTDEISYIYNSTESSTTPSTYTLSDNLDVNGNLTITAATLEANGKNISLAGDWSNSGTFTHSSGTITIDGSGTSQILGATTFNNFTCTTAGKTIEFEAQSGGDPVFTFAGTFTLTGTDGNKINLQSTSSGTQWYPYFNSAQTTVTYTNVKDSGGDTGTATVSNLSTSNNISGNDLAVWLFNQAPTNDSLTFTNPYSGTSDTAVSDDTTEWQFRALVSDTDGPTNIDYVELRFANSTDSTQPYDSLKLRWTESTDTFSEEADTQSAVTLTSTGSDSNASGNQWTLDFKIKFNDSFATKDTLYAAELFALDDASATDSDNYTNKYKVVSLSLSLIVNNNTLNFGSLLPGSVVTGTTQTTVNTNYPNGYSLGIHDNIASTNSALLHTDATTRIADYAGTIDTPTTWSDTGLGICLYEGTNKDSKWGTGTTENDSNNKYAGIPQNSTLIMSKTSSPTVNDIAKIGYKLVVPLTQKTGSYSGNVTFTATGVLQ